MTDLEVHQRAEPSPFPAPSSGVAASPETLPPPSLRVPAMTPASLPQLSGVPVVPPMPKFSLDEIDGTDANGLASTGLNDDVADHGRDDQPDDGECYPTADAVLGASPSEPLGAPPAVAMVAPVLPSVVAAPSPSDTAGPTSHHPSQKGAASTGSLTAALVAPPQAKETRNVKRAVARTMLAVVLAGAAGAAAHVGYDWYENRDAAAVAEVDIDGNNIASWPEVDLPAIRYTDTVTEFSTPAGTHTLTAHREISSGRTQAEIVDVDLEGTELNAVGVDLRGDHAFIRGAGGVWAAADPAGANDIIGDTWTTDVFTARDLFPIEAVPYMTVLESVERILPVEPLSPAARPDGPTVTPMATSTDPTSAVWKYRVIIDVDSFRTNETAAHQEWTRRLGRNAVSRIDAWVDPTGIVRQLAVDVDGAVVTHTLVGGSAESSRFDTDPLSAPATDVAAAPTASPLPDEASE